MQFSLILSLNRRPQVGRGVFCLMQMKSRSEMQMIPRPHKATTKSLISEIPKRKAKKEKKTQLTPIWF